MRPLAFLWILLGLCLSNCSRQPHSDQTQESNLSQTIDPRRVEILFLGHASEHHPSSKYAPILTTALFKTGINITYTEDIASLNPENLRKYDGLVVYANHDSIAPAQASALVEFVESGKGFIPIHSASWCFRNSDEVVQLIGGQFHTHKTGTFTAKVTRPEHPAMQGFSEFETWDETYVHQKINPDIQVLMERVEGDHREPYTWVRTQGKGRVFYTALGHDERTWNQPEFHQLIENGILWAVGDQVKDALARLNIPTPVYTDAEIPNYEKRDPAPQLQQPFTAAESQKFIQVPVDFELELFAAEPDITNPIAMAWDERGRLWIAETIDYPNEVRDEEGVGEDRIKICEDTNGDGKADKFTIFADKLNIPTSIVFANGGLIVAQAPHFLFLKDTNGDDKADVREVLMTGWGKSDTHAGPSTLKYGFDNRIWGVLGYSGFNGQVGGESMRFGQGVYHFTPDGKKLEYLGRTSNNTWGLGFSETNDIFISTANNTHSAYFSMPNRYTKRVLTGGNGQTVHKIDGHYDMPIVFPNLRQVDVHGGYTAAAGHNLYTARNFPKSYWNRIAFVCEPTGRVLHNAILEPKGAGFAEKNGNNLLASSDEWVGPVHAEVGPDGAVWVADWYDFIIQHNPTPRGFDNGKGNAYIIPLRDKERGRIYRIKYKNAKPYEPITLSKDDTQGLLAALENDNMFWRMTAQRLLVEAKNTAVLPGLYAIINKQNVDEIGLNSPAVHALWTLHGLGALDGSNAEAIKVVTQALSHPAAGVRKAAAQVLPRNGQSAGSILKANLVKDPDLHTRLAGILAIADMPASPELGQLVHELAMMPDNAGDPHLSQALYAAALAHQDGFMAAYHQNHQMHASETGEPTLVQRMEKGLREEVYPLERWNQMLAKYAPDVTNKEITIRASLAKGDRDMQGIVMAQGGKDNGYSLYVQDGKLNLLVRQNGKAYKATTTKALPSTFDVVARLTKNGQLSIEVDGSPAAKGKAADLFKAPLTQGLRVGLDNLGEDRVGDYPAENFNFAGELKNASLQLNKPGEGAKAASMVAVKNNAGTGAESGSKAPRSITLKVKEHVMKYDKETLTVQAGETIDIVFENPDFMQHNLLIIKPGTLEKVGAAADALARDPKGAELNYVPQMPEVLFATKLVDPNGKTVLRVTAPSTPGDYPYVCTFPGHWRIMNGVMKVVKN